MPYDAALVTMYTKVNQLYIYLGFPGGASGKESACSAGDPGSVLGSRRSPGRGAWQPTLAFLPENPMNRGPWWATVHMVAESETTEAT